MYGNISLNEGSDWLQVAVSNLTPLTAVIDLVPGLRFGDFILVQMEAVTARAQIAYTDETKNLAVVSFLGPTADPETQGQLNSSVSINAVELLDVPKETFSKQNSLFDDQSDQEITNIQPREADLLMQVALPEEIQVTTATVDVNLSLNDHIETHDIPDDFLPEIQVDVPSDNSAITNDSIAVNTPIPGEPIHGYIEPERIDILTDFAVSESDTLGAVANVNPSDPPVFFEEGSVVLFYTTDQFLWHYEHNLKHFALLLEETSFALGSKHRLRLTILGSELSLSLNCQVRYTKQGLTGFSLPDDHESQAMLRGIVLICRS